ncbi:translation elongation factor Ts [Telmatocola sphagniphila]|uniref:Elongation factor Ts n=1 Tax=Telmatocola sphagniphila TaxID=1123043 RepID=A0A8E6EX36_9BACT|nr:translation elongation factor Ts [Telmatocola sphagniphila]QVL34462.1 translation elongation factor Ts [Telmatocola sphagniphila]
MSAITAAAVNELRKRTDLPLMECKSALTEAAGDMDKAVMLLRERFKSVSNKRAGNETAEGRVGVYIDAGTKTASILEMRCESAPVTKSEQFIALVADLAKQVAVQNPADVATLSAAPFVGNSALTVTDRINEVIGLIRENMKVQRFTRLTGGLYGNYIHHDGTLGVLLEVTGKDTASPELLRDICAHIAAMNPVYASVDQLPTDVLEREKELAKKLTDADPKNAGKPANIVEKIIEGKLKTWYAETVLLEQPIANAAKYDKKTVGQLLSGAGLKLVKYVRYKVGEIV